MATINANAENIELINRQQACELLGMTHPTFFRYYAKSLTTYKNAENPKDQRHFFDKQEILDLVEIRRAKKEGIPIKVTVLRKPSNV